MPTLVLIRHAKAEGTPSRPGGDHARVLVDRGRQDATTLGRILTEGGWAPDLALVSTAARAWQTLEALVADEPVETWPTRRIYDGGIDGVLEAIHEVPASVEVLWVVGHEPIMSSAAWDLTDSGAPDAGRERLHGGLSTASAAVLELDGPWSDAGMGAGRLLAVRRARD